MPQRVQAPDDPILRTTVDLAQVDAAVTDGSGRHVTDHNPLYPHKIVTRRATGDARRSANGSRTSNERAGPARLVRHPPEARGRGLGVPHRESVLGVFHAAGPVTYGYQVLNAILDPASRKPQLEAGLRMYRDGKPFWERKTAPTDCLAGTSGLAQA